MPCLVAILSEIACAFSQKIVTSGGNEMQEKDELYRQHALSAIRTSAFSIRCRMAANHPDHARAAWAGG